MSRRFSSLLVFLSAIYCLAGSHFSVAEQYEQYDNYQVHYIALSSELIEPQIAQRYQLVRARNRGLLNISVRQLQDNGGTLPVRATINGSVTNLLQQRQPLQFQQVIEGDSIYYLAQFRFSDQEVLRFSIQLQPEHSAGEYRLNFSNQMFFERDGKKHRTGE